MSGVMLELSAASQLQRVTLWLEEVAAQFHDLDTSDPSLWPVWPRLLLCITVVVVVLVLAGYGPVRWLATDWKQLQQIETRLREEYSQKLAEAINRKPLELQREQASQHIQVLQGHMPGALEMANMLTAINQLGATHALQFEWFRPEGEVAHDFYVEQPVSIRISGSFDSMAAFASDLAHLSHVVILDSVVMLAGDSAGQILVLDAMVRIYRRLNTDAAPVELQESAQP